MVRKIRTGTKIISYQSCLIIVLIDELPEDFKRIIVFLHFVFYGLIVIGTFAAEWIFMVSNYSLFNQEFSGFEAQAIMGIMSTVGIIAGIMIWKSIKGGNFLS